VQTDIDPRELIGHKAVDRNGDKIGTVDEVYLDDATGEPEWAAVRTGLFGRDAFVPLSTSEFVSDELRVPYDKAQVKDSPDFGVGQHLSPAQELQLYRYYGLEVPSTADQGAEPAMADGMAHRGTANGAAHLAMEATAPSAAAAAVVPPPVQEEQVAEPRVEQPRAEPVRAAAPTPAPAPAATPTPAPTPMPREEMPAPSPAPAAPAPAAQAPAPAPAPVAEQRPAAAAQAPAGRTAAFFTEHEAAHEPAPAAPVTGRERPTTDVGEQIAATPSPRPVEVVCSEERLEITTEWHELGRARLRKYVTTEQIERRIPVVRERVRVERVPLRDEERAGLTDREIAEATQEVTLHEERVVVRRTVVPVERIRLITERITEEEVVREQVQREHVQIHDGAHEALPEQQGAVTAAQAAPPAQAPQPEPRYSGLA
jgi:uncharacterized protein (TIGR02271 family)